MIHMVLSHDPYIQPVAGIGGHTKRVSSRHTGPEQYQPIAYQQDCRNDKDGPCGKVLDKDGSKKIAEGYPLQHTQYPGMRDG